MKRKGHIFFLIFSLSTCHVSILAQKVSIIDSLKQVLQTTISDSIRASTYSDLSWNYAITRTKLDTARMFADSLKLISIKNNLEQGLVKSYFNHGLIKRFEGKYTEGIENMENFVNYYQQHGDSTRVAAGLFQIASMNYVLGNYLKSLSDFQRVLSIYKRNEDAYNVASLLHPMAHIQRKLNKHEKAIQSYKEAIVLWEQLNNKGALAMSTESLGNTYGELKQYNKAEEYLLSALAIGKNEKNPSSIASVSENLGNLYGRMGKYEKALEFHLESLNMRSTMPSKRNLVISLNQVGATYMKLGDYDKAREYLLNGLEIGEEMKIAPLIIESSEILTELYELMGQKDKAFDYQKTYITLKDSMFTIEKNKQLAELETKYETAQKDQEITLLTKENEVQEAKAAKESTLRNALIGGLLLLAIIAGLIFYAMRARLKNQKLLAVKNEEIKMAYIKEQLGTLEMKALRAQMNPHFLFNCMNSINRMIISEDNDNASKYLTKFSKLVRLMLENSENPKVTLKDELEMLTAYIQLEAIRFKNKMEYKINVSKSLDQESTFIPSMVLQPFVENAIWHGLLHKGGKGLLTIDIKEEGDNLYCSITDNGVGREKSLKLQKQSGHKKSSMGIKITTDRLKLLTKQKINEAIKILDLKDSENNVLGTQVNILIPIS